MASDDMDLEKPAQMTVEAPGARTRETLSQLVARILDQLSLSAWLPAGALVSIAVFLVGVRAEGSVAAAMSGIIEMGWTSLALLIGAVVLVTMITQAFAFGAIRLLEGYWGPSQVANKLADIGCWNRRRIRRRLEERLDRYQTEAGAMSREKMLRSKIPKEIVDLVEAMRVGTLRRALTLNCSGEQEEFHGAPPHLLPNSVASMPCRGGSLSTHWSIESYLPAWVT